MLLFSMLLCQNDDIETIMNEGLEMAADVDPSDKLTTTWSTIKVY